MVAAHARTGSIDDLSERALAAASPEDRARCLGDIEAALEWASGPVEQGRLLICRALVRHNQYEYRLVLDDALAAMALFEEAGETGLAIDAASRGSVLASRLGEQSLAADLVTKTVLGLAAVDDHRLTAAIANRLGAFYCSLLDYDRGVAYFEMGLAAAEHAEDGYLACLELYNISNALLMAVRANRAADPSASPLRPEDSSRLERAGLVLERLLAEVTPERQLSLSAQLLRAELFVDTDQPARSVGGVGRHHQGGRWGRSRKRRPEGCLRCRRVTLPARSWPEWRRRRRRRKGSPASPGQRRRLRALAYPGGAAGRQTSGRRPRRGCR